MSAPMMRLPDEVLYAIFSYLEVEQLMHEVRLVNSTCNRVATSNSLLDLILPLCSLDKLRRTAEFYDRHPPSMLFQARSVQLGADGWKVDEMNATDLHDTKEMVKRLSQWFPKVRRITLPFPQSELAPSAQTSDVVNLLLEQFRAMPTLTRLITREFPLVAPSEMPLLPSHLTFLDLRLMRPGASLDAFFAVLKHMPHLSGLRFEARLNHPNHASLPDNWIADGIKHKKERQHHAMRRLCLSLDTIDDMFPINRTHLLAFLFFTFPKLVGLDLELMNFNLNMDDARRPTEHMPGALVELMGCPKRLTVDDNAFIENPFEFNTLLQLRGTPVLPVAHPEVLHLAVYNTSTMWTWMTRIPCDNVKLLYLDCEPEGDESLIAVEHLSNVLKLTSQLHTLHLEGLVVDTRPLGPGQETDPFADTDSPLYRSAITNCRFTHCLINTPLVIQRLVGLCPQITHLQFLACRFVNTDRMDLPDNISNPHLATIRHMFVLNDDDSEDPAHRIDPEIEHLIGDVIDAAIDRFMGTVPGGWPQQARRDGLVGDGDGEAHDGAVHDGLDGQLDGEMDENQDDAQDHDMDDDHDMDHHDFGDDDEDDNDDDDDDDMDDDIVVDDDMDEEWEDVDDDGNNNNDNNNVDDETMSNLSDDWSDDLEEDLDEVDSDALSDYDHDYVDDEQIEPDNFEPVRWLSIPLANLTLTFKRPTRTLFIVLQDEHHTQNPDDLVQMYLGQGPEEMLSFGKLTIQKPKKLSPFETQWMLTRYPSIEEELKATDFPTATLRMAWDRAEEAKVMVITCLSLKSGTDLFGGMALKSIKEIFGSRDVALFK
ncbi:hypothetical protein BC940DRAFT_291197 [Gongronella butleri]|nr:hypothetical protein BC940DRAFT_291197 [Gongronella butleri]